MQCIWQKSWVWYRTICSGEEHKALTGISTCREAGANRNSVLSGVRVQVTVLPVQCESWEPFCLPVGAVAPLLSPSVHAKSRAQALRALNSMTVALLPVHDDG